MYAIINKENRVVSGFVGDVKTIENDLIVNEEKAIKITVDNSPASQGDYWNGHKFVKELADV